MAGSLTKIEAHEILFHKGDPSDSMYTIVSGEMDVFDPISDDDKNREIGNRVMINRLKTGDVLGEMGFLRSVPRSATVVATTPVELLKINWKMIKRLQWLYPPTAHKFFLNLMGVTCDRLENLTECFAEIKIHDDSKGLCTRDKFLKILATEIERARHHGTTLSLCFMKLEFEKPKNGDDNPAKERMICTLGDTMSREIRNWDTLSRYGLQTFALLMPQTAQSEAQQFCNRLKQMSENNYADSDDIRIKFTFGLAEFSHEQNETGAELLAKATAILQNEG
jgi:hypothetical protein